MNEELNVSVGRYCVGKVDRTGTESYSVMGFENNLNVVSACAA